MPKSCKFLENNGRNLKEIHLCCCDCNSLNLINLAIAKFCTNLKSLYTKFKNDEAEALKMILIIVNN